MYLTCYVEYVHVNPFAGGEAWPCVSPQRPRVTICCPSAGSRKPGDDAVDRSERAEFEKRHEIALEDAIRRAEQAHESSHTGGALAFYPGGSLLCPGGETSPAGRKYCISQDQATVAQARDSLGHLEDEAPPPGGTFYPGGTLCPSGERAPKGGVFHNSQGDPVDEHKYTDTQSSTDIHSSRRNSRPGLKFFNGNFLPGGGRAPKGWYYNSQREWVRWSPSQTAATKRIESRGDQKGTGESDNLHGDRPAPPAKGEEHSPGQREHSQAEHSDQRAGAVREEDKTPPESAEQGGEAGSQAEPLNAQECEAGNAQHSGSTTVSNAAREESSASSAVKWVVLEHEAGELRTTEEAGGVLSAVHEDQVVNVLTIVGAAKQGKSFLMNALTGFDNVFPVSPEPTACTAGADLSPILMRLPEFTRGGGGVAASSPCQPHPTVAFVDMEGQGDKSPEHDVRLATPFLLVSKVSPR